jgi:hypothetical protein
VVEPVDTTPRTLQVPELERVGEVLALTPPSEN